MIELLIALLIKFWMFLCGTIRGALSVVPFVQRWRLSGGLESELRDRQLMLRAGKRHLLLPQLRIFAFEGARIVPVTSDDSVLAAGESRQFALTEAARACVLMIDLIDLNSRRNTHEHRRLEPTKDPKPSEEVL